MLFPTAAPQLQPAIDRSHRYVAAFFALALVRRGSFDIIFGPFACSRVSQLHVTPHTPCAMIYLVPVFITC